MADKVETFNWDLDHAMTEIRRVIDHWGLSKKGWTEYLVIRHPEQDGGFIVKAHPSDTSDFAEKLVALHKSEVKTPAR